MREDEIVSEDIRRALALQQVRQILNILVRDYIDPNDRTQDDARQAATRYAAVQRDYWENNSSVKGSGAYKQIWTDALVQIATEGNWQSIKTAVEFDAINFREKPTVTNQAIYLSLSNLAQLL